MVVVMEKYNSVGIVCAPLQIIDENGKKITPKFYLVKKMIDLYRYRKQDTLLDKKVILRDFLTKEYPCCVPSGILYRKECFDKLGTFDKKFRYICDVELCMRFATRYDFYYLDKYLSSWRYTPSSETIAILHKKGISPKMFYDLTNKYLSQSILNMFSQGERKQIIRDSYLFASKRMILNVIAGIKKRDVKMVANTLIVINKNDPYLFNKIKLPFVILREILVAFAYHSMVLFKGKTPI
jgi:GT2 family glycosyltransferase